MTRGILVVGNESALFSAIEAEAAKRVEQYAAAIIPGPFAPPQAEGAGGGGAAEPRAGETEKGRVLLSWNSSSPLSARTLILGAENRLGRVDEALLVCWPPAFYRSAEALAPADVDKYINDQIKSWFFLVRELTAVFRARGGGTLSLVIPDESFGNEKNSAGKEANADLLGPPAAASFRALAQGLLASSAGAAFRILGFTGCNAGAEKEFAAWLFKTLDEGGRKNTRTSTAGRLHKYSRLPFFK